LEASDITARICGICPLAYVFAACRAMEKILGIDVPEEIRALRKIAFYGEWIESHVLHFAFLHAPDFLGYHSALEVAKDYPDFVRDAIAVRSWGNKAIEIIGGRPIHPIGFRVGGLYRIIRRGELEPLARDYDEVRRKGERLLEFILNLDLPDVECNMAIMSLKGRKEYPILDGMVANNLGWEFPEDSFEENVIVEQKKYSTGLHYRLRNDRPYITGPIARFNLNYSLLAPEVRDILERAGYRAPLKNTYQSIVARAAETLHSIIEIGRLVEEYSEPSAPYVEAAVRAGEAAAIVEAPRGMLYHRYKIDERGRILYANIVPPTTQNYVAMEDDIFKVGDLILSGTPEKAQQIVETTIRNYDPCISCSVHTIKLRIINE
jgi:coenzyme F420-reducing hydrogenase alpha subunit